MWTNERIAGTQLGWAGLPAVLFFLLALTLALPGRVLAEDGAAGLRAQLGIRGALEIGFFAQRGKAYTVEAQTGAGEWESVYGPVYGEDQAVVDFVSGSGYQAYRLQVEELAGLGFAPAALEGHAYSLNGGRAVGFLFATALEGVATGQDGVQRGFTYTYLKTAPDLAQLVINYLQGGTDQVALKFYEGRVGTFQSMVTRAGRRARLESGTFRAGDDVDPANAAPPASVDGISFVFRDRGMMVGLSFDDESSGTFSRQGGDAEVISYTYDVTPWHEALLVVYLGGGERHEYTMNFGARNSGMFVRHVIKDNKVKDTDKGRFSGKGKRDEDDDGKGGGNTERECVAPADLKGKTLSVSINGRTVTIILKGAGSGSVFQHRPNGRVSFKPFTYTYSKASGTEGLLTITFPTVGDDDVEVYELDFSTSTSGDCKRKRYEGGQLDGTANGTFTLSDAEQEANDNQGDHDDD